MYPLAYKLSGKGEQEMALITKQKTTGKLMINGQVGNYRCLY